MPLETWSGFTSLFDDGSSGAGSGTDYVAAAVRSFFAQGGKLCYVVRVCDPVTAEDDKKAKIKALLPSDAYAPDSAPSWTGVGSLAVLEDVSFLVTPDLPVLCASQQIAAAGQVPAAPTGPEEFVECSQGDIVLPQGQTVPAPAPRLTAADYTTWAASLAVILNYLAGGSLTHQLHLREIQFVAAFPIPQDLDAATAAENPSSADIAQDIHAVIQAKMPEKAPPVDMVAPCNISSAFPSTCLSVAEDFRLQSSIGIAGTTRRRAGGAAGSQRINTRRLHQRHQDYSRGNLRRLAHASFSGNAGAPRRLSFGMASLPLPSLRR